MSVCMYIFYLVVVLRDKLKMTAFHMYGLVKYNFYGILLIKRQHFDYALRGKTFAIIFFSDTLPKHWSCGDYEFNIILPFFSLGYLFAVAMHPVSTLFSSFRETTVPLEMLLERAAVACPPARYILTFIHTY